MPNLPDAASALTNMAQSLNLRDDFAVYKSGIERQYTDRLEAIADSEADEQRKRDEIIALILLFLLLAYLDGQRSMGVNVTEGTLTGDDRIALAALQAGQLEFAAGLAEAMKAADTERVQLRQAVQLRDEITSNPSVTPAERQAANTVVERHQVATIKARAEVTRRVGMWGGSLAVARLAGIKAGGDKRGVEVYATWKYDPTKEHCEAHDGRVSCEWLNGQRHPLSWYFEHDYIPRQAGSKTLGCGGWECGCRLELDSKGQLI